MILSLIQNIYKVFDFIIGFKTWQNGIPALVPLLIEIIQYFFPSIYISNDVKLAIITIALWIVGRLSPSIPNMLKTIRNQGTTMIVMIVFTSLTICAETNTANAQSKKPFRQYIPINQRFVSDSGTQINNLQLYKFISVIYEDSGSSSNGLYVIGLDVTQSHDTIRYPLRFNYQGVLQDSLCDNCSGWIMNPLNVSIKFFRKYSLGSSNPALLRIRKCQDD